MKAQRLPILGATLYYEMRGSGLTLGDEADGHRPPLMAIA